MQDSWFSQLCITLNINKPDVFVETGTYLGNGIEKVKNDFREVHSIELNTTFYLDAKDKFKNLSHIYLHNGDSAEVLNDLIHDLKEDTMFYLDAHYSGGPTSYGKMDDNGCPVLRELEILGKRHQKDIIIIDDMRLMGKQSYSGTEGDEVYPVTFFNFEHVTLETIKKSYGRPVHFYHCTDIDRLVLLPEH